MTATRDIMQAAKERFEKDTAEHELKIEHDDGLYKHLRFAKPGTNIYSFSIATWPGYLAIAGDVPTFIFSREPDMLTFFERCHGHPDPVYLSGKLSGEFNTKRYSPEAFKARVQEWLDEKMRDLGDDARDFLHDAVQRELLSCAPGFKEEALPLLESFSAESAFMECVTISEAYEWDLTEWDQNFLWCLWAIVHVIDLYRKATTPLPVQPACACGHRYDHHGHGSTVGSTACKQPDCRCGEYRPVQA